MILELYAPAAALVGASMILLWLLSLRLGNASHRGPLLGPRLRADRRADVRARGAAQRGARRAVVRGHGGLGAAAVAAPGGAQRGPRRGSPLPRAAREVRAVLVEEPVHRVRAAGRADVGGGLAGDPRPGAALCAGAHRARSAGPGRVRGGPGLGGWWPIYSWCASREIRRSAGACSTPACGATRGTPNYFGELVLWWGLGLMACSTPGAAWAAVLGPATITWLLARVSGVPMLEAGMKQRRPEYAAYVARTRALVPGPPRRS
jgi:hypothetical protein